MKVAKTLLRYAIYDDCADDRYNLWAAESVNSSVKVRVAKNEYHNIQIAFFARQSIKKVTLTLDFAYPNSGIDIFVRRLESFHHWEDALVPCQSFELKAEMAEVIWLTIRTSVGTVSRKYRGHLKVRYDDGQICIPIEVDVKKFVLPVRSSVPVVFGIIEKKLEQFYGLGANDSKSKNSEREKIFANWYDFVSRYRISPYFCSWLDGSMAHEVKPFPVSLLSRKAGRYLNDSRLTRFAIPFYSVSESELRKIISKLRKLKLLDKGFFYIWDEPDNLDTYNKIYAYVAKIRKIAPEAKVLTSFYCGPNKGNLFELPEKMRGYTNIFCISSWAFQADESVSQRFKKLLAEDEELWTYVCCGPGNPHPNFLLGMRGIQNRAIMWRVWKEQIEGFLYWAVNSFEIESEGQISLRKDLPPGDGLLVYPGEIFSVSGLVSSIRLERFLSGLQDYEYLSSAEKKIGRSKVLKILNTVYKSPESITDSHRDVVRFREKLLDIVS